MKILFRLTLLLTVLAAITGLALLFRRIGLGEWGILLGILAWFIGVESAVYIARRFLKGYRHGVAQRTKKRK